MLTEHEGYGATLSESVHQAVVNMLAQLVNTPLSLQAVCRLRIRHSLTGSIPSDVTELPVPMGVKEYLLLAQ